jgi:hypothetical protein
MFGIKFIEVRRLPACSNAASARPSTRGWGSPFSITRRPLPLVAVPMANPSARFIFQETTADFHTAPSKAR